MSNVVILPDAGAVAREGADRFVALARSAIAASGRFTVALSGGSTPRALFAQLIDRPIEWARVHVFWGDERCVPPDHADSNYRMAHETLLSRVPVLEQHVHRMQGELDPAQAASEYEAELRDVFGQPQPERSGGRPAHVRCSTGASVGRPASASLRFAQAAPVAQSKAAFPRFDLILLGLGPDAHTASLFPGASAIHEQQRWVIGHFVEKLHVPRLTLTPPVINHAKNVIFLVAGADKAAAIRSVVTQLPRDPDRFPAQIVQPIDGALTWLIDQAAAADLAMS